MAVLGPCCCSCYGERGLPLIAVWGLLTAGASLVAEHGLWGTQASVAGVRGLRGQGSRALRHRLSSWGSRALKHRLSGRGSWALRCRLSGRGSWAWLLRGMWGLPGPGIELCLRHWQGDSSPLSHQRSPNLIFFQK